MISARALLGCIRSVITGDTLSPLILIFKGYDADYNTTSEESYTLQKPEYTPTSGRYTVKGIGHLNGIRAGHLSYQGIVYDIPNGILEKDLLDSYGVVLCTH